MKKTNKEYMEAAYDFLLAESFWPEKKWESLVIRSSFPSEPNRIILSFDAVNHSVHLEGEQYMSVDKKDYLRIYKVLTECTRFYPFVKFLLDEEFGEVKIIADEHVTLNNVGKICVELLVLVYSAAQEAMEKLEG